LEHLKSLKENLKSLNKTRGFYENTKYKWKIFNPE
jgi:hypothetical protein